MNYLKILAVTAVAALALMAFAGGASATTLTVRNGDNEETVTGTTTLPSSLEGGVEATLNGSFGEIKCRQSILEVRLTNPGSATETVEGFVNELTFGFCNGQVKVLASGFSAIHTEGASANGKEQLHPMAPRSQWNSPVSIASTRP